MRREMTQKRRFVGQAHTFNPFAVPEDLNDDFNQIIDMTLRVNAPRHCQPDEVHLCRTRKHQGANLDRTHTPLEVQFGTECYTGELMRWNVRQESARIDIDGMASRRLNYRYSGLRDVVAQIRR